MTLQQLLDYLNTTLRAEEFTDYCPNGLQVQGREDVEKVGFAVTASLETIEKAIDLGCDALVVHHGLFWKGDPYPITGPKAKKVGLLLKNKCSLLAYHLPLDAHRTVGNNWCAANQLGWTDLCAFGKMGGEEIGVAGVFAPIEISLFVEKLEKYYNHCAHKALGGKKKISSCALISGGAYRSIVEAKEKGYDCFITGNFDEPAWHLAHEYEMNFIAMGHAATERIGPQALMRAVGDTLDCQTIYVSDENPF